MASQTDPRRREVSPDQRRSARNKTTNSKSRDTKDTPDQEEERIRTNPTIVIQEANTEENEVDQEGPIRNTAFPTYKLYRKQHMKITNAKHHVEFLSNLRDNHQVPKGLKPKVTVTTTELPPRLYIRWERAHIELANTLRDILLEFWQETAIIVQTEIQRTFEELEPLCNQEELSTISNLIKKAVTAKEEDLKKRRLNKEKNIRKPGASGGTSRSRSRTKNN